MTPEEVSEAIGPGPEDGAPIKGHIPFSADSKKVLELSLREAIRSNARSIGTEHILLAVLRIRDSQGGKILGGLGVTYKDIEGWLEEAAA